MALSSCSARRYTGEYPLKGLIVGARSFPGNPYDGHTLHAQLEQTTILPQDLPGSPRPRTAIVDLGTAGSTPKWRQ